jgi:hypothetical protein
MLDSIFTTILTTGTFTASEFVIVTVTAFVCGLIIAAAYMLRNHYSKSFIVTLVLLPAIVELVIIMVNGNIGAGVAVAGAFSLVRFRSVPGRGQEIAGIFLAMAVGLAAGMGYIGIAVMFTVVVSGLGVLMNLLRFGAEDKGIRRLRIMIPENLDYEGRFEEVFNKYLREYTYDEVRTANMGSMYKLTLSVIPKERISTMEFLDEMRTLNGNLDISLGRATETQEAL